MFANVKPIYNALNSPSFIKDDSVFKIKSIKNKRKYKCGDGRIVKIGGELGYTMDKNTSFHYYGGDSICMSMKDAVGQLVSVPILFESEKKAEKIWNKLSREIEKIEIEYGKSRA